MAQNFLSGDRDQLWLLPPSVVDWLPEGHLAWFVIDVVDEFDLSGFVSRYRDDGRGGAAYSPKASVEPVFAQIKHNRRIRDFSRRGIVAVDHEWKLVTTTHNLLKLWRATPTTA